MDPTPAHPAAPATGRGFATANVVIGALFLLSAALQLNDPDPWAWVALYAAAGAACFLRHRLPRAAAVVLVVTVAWLLWLAPTAIPQLNLREIAGTMKADTPSIELTRELLGLLIVAAWMAVLARSAR